MDVSHTKKSTRIVIWAIAIVMAVGSVGAYFLVMLQNNDAANNQAQLDQPAEGEPVELPVDPSAHKVTAKVEKLEVTDLTTGNGTEAKAGDTVTAHYKGTIANTGQKFDSSYDRGEPLELPLIEGNVIAGWIEGVPGMKVGGKRRLVIPAEKAYGAQPPEQSGIPANADLVFEVELLGVTPPATQ